MTLETRIITRSRHTMKKRSRAWMLVLFLGSTLATARAQQIHLRIINGHSGKPVVNATVITLITPGPAHPVANLPTTDANGLTTLSVPVDGRVSAVVTSYPTCRHVAKVDRTRSPISFSISQVESSGIVEMNNCSKQIAPPTPGELTLFVRPLHWWERLSD